MTIKIETPLQATAENDDETLMNTDTDDDSSVRDLSLNYKC